MAGSRTASQAVRFVEGLALPQAATIFTQASAHPSFVVAGSLVCVSADVPSQAREDCINSTLLAQLAATHQHDRMTDAANWYSDYINVLANLGWDAQSFTFGSFATNGDVFTLDQPILQYIESLGADNEVANVAYALVTIKGLGKDDKRLGLWESNSHAGQRGNFQIISVTMTDAIPVIKLGGFYLNTSNNITSLLFYDFDTLTDAVNQAVQTMNLNVDVYSGVRDQVKQKLGNRVNDLVLELDVPNPRASARRAVVGQADERTR